MISSLELANVRIFQGTGWTFSFPLLSVICGTNSCGKSTILKTLLLLRQSQEIGDSQETSSGRLRFSGNEGDLGRFQSFVSQNDESLDITLSITIKDKISSSALIHFYESSKGKNKHSDGLRPPRHSEEEYSLRSFFIFGLRTSKLILIHSQEEDPDDDSAGSTVQQVALLKKAHFELVQQDKPTLSWRIESTWGKPGGEKNIERFELLLQRQFLEIWNRPYGFRFGELGDASDKEFARFEVRLSGLLPSSMRVKVNLENGKKRKDAPTRFVDWPLPPPIEIVLRDLRHALRSIHYLGPLRTPAKRYYIAHLDASPSMDSEGEFLPYILREMRDKSVLGVLLKNPNEDSKESLVRALNSWLYYFRSGHRSDRPDQVGEIEIRSTKGVLLELQLRGQFGNSRHALADSGFGYSQVLPILVRGLLATPGDILIVEQPELHLHPALQVRLAEFFVEMAKLGKQVLLETHSEHLVNAIRVLAAEDQSGTVSSNCGIIFIDALNKVPHIRQLEVQSDGTMPEWPSSFFGDALELSSRLLKAQSKLKNLG